MSAKTIVRVVWAAGVVLAILHLRALAGAEVHAGFWPFAIFLVACYSVPFFWLTRIEVPAKAALSKYITLALFLLIFAFGLFLPTRRFFPGYRPDALESLAYLFLPLVECGLIGVFLVARTFAVRLTRGG